MTFRKLSFMLKTYVHKLGTVLYAFLLVIELNAIAEKISGRPAGYVLKGYLKFCRFAVTHIINLLFEAETR